MDAIEWKQLQDGAVDLWGEALAIWSKGGWAMFAIAAISLSMAAMGFHIWLRLNRRQLRSVSERRWRSWIDKKELRRGRLGEFFDLVLADKSHKDVESHFDQLRATELAPFERDLKVMKICVNAAPLVGLLGTVTGMLATFGALSEGSGGDQTMGMIAAGISEALITTETGLVVALPGLFFHHFLERKLSRYKLFIAHLETVCSQVIYRREEERVDRLFAHRGSLGAQLRSRISQSKGRMRRSPTPGGKAGRSNMTPGVTGGPLHTTGNETQNEGPQ